MGFGVEFRLSFSYACIHVHECLFQRQMRWNLNIYHFVNIQTLCVFVLLSVFAAEFAACWPEVVDGGFPLFWLLPNSMISSSRLPAESISFAELN